MFGSDLRRVCLMVGDGEGEFPRISEVIVFATTLECNCDSVKRMSCVDDSGIMVGGNGTYGLNKGTAYVCSVDGGVPGSPLAGVVCLSVIILSIIVLILMLSCVRIKYKCRYKYIYPGSESAFLNKIYIFGWKTVINSINLTLFQILDSTNNKNEK